MCNDLISVIVPIYKVEQYLDRCINSIVKQFYLNLEIILVDDGSPDNCPEKCDRWATIDKRIKVIHKKNGGLSSARNAGLDACTGKYISFIDSDDWIEETYYSEITSLMKDNHADIGCAGRYDVDAETLQKKCGLCPTHTHIISPEEMIKKILTWEECDSSVCDKVFDAALWSDMRFPVGITSEDVAVTYKVVGRASKIIMLSKPMYNYFHHHGSITTSFSSSKSMHVVALADEICEYVEQFHPYAFPEAKYFKFKTLLHWNRAHALQINPSTKEKSLSRSSRKWLLTQIVFVLFISKYIKLKDKLWCILIVLGMKKTIRTIVSKNIR